MHDIYLCLGAKYFQRAYHMMYQSFCKLHQEVKEGIERAHKHMLEKTNKQRRAWCQRKRKAHNAGGRHSNQPQPPPIPNGTISSEVWLACALRYFCGGSQYDIMVKCNVSHTEMMNSVWYIIEVSCPCPSQYPFTGTLGYSGLA